MSIETFTLADACQHKVNLGTYNRNDGETFQIDAKLFETPIECNYWLVYINADHKQWGNTPFKLMIPKKIVKNFEQARAITCGSAFDQVKEILSMLTSGSRNFTITESHDGWILL